MISHWLRWACDNASFNTNSSTYLIDIICACAVQWCHRIFSARANIDLFPYTPNQRQWPREREAVVGKAVCHDQIRLEYRERLILAIHFVHSFHLFRSYLASKACDCVSPHSPNLSNGIVVTHEDCRIDLQCHI